MTYVVVENKDILCKGRLNQAAIQWELNSLGVSRGVFAARTRRWSQRRAELPQQIVEISRKIVKGAIMMLRLTCNHDEIWPGRGG